MLDTGCWMGTPLPGPLPFGRGEGEAAGRLVVDWDAEAFAAEQQPEDAEFPVFKTIYVGMGLIVEIVERTGGDEIFAAAFAARKQERDVGDLFGEDGGGA